MPGSAAWLIRTDAGGDTLWTRTFGGVGTDGGLSVQVTADDGYILAGSTTTFCAGGADVWLVKVGGSGVAAVDEQPPGIPGKFALHQNYPNPFNPSTTLRLALPQAAQVTLLVYDLLGREVARLLDGAWPAGTHHGPGTGGIGGAGKCPRACILPG